MQTACFLHLWVSGTAKGLSTPVREPLAVYPEVIGIPGADGAVCSQLHSEREPLTGLDSLVPRGASRAEYLGVEAPGQQGA